jgi:hypothetical protein
MLGDTVDGVSFQAETQHDAACTASSRGSASGDGVGVVVMRNLPSSNGMEYADD